MNKKYARGNVEGIRLQRLTDICKYALRKQDYSLFQSAIYKVGSLNHPEKGYEYLDFLFYEKVVEAYLYTPKNDKVEETLILYWFYTFDKSKIPNLGNVRGMLGKMMSAVMSERISLFEKYIHRVKYGYHFILDVPVVTYVRGLDVESQKQVANEMRDAWFDLTQMHYIALACLLSQGHTEIVRIIESVDSLSQGGLLSRTGPDILKLFAQCKEHQINDGKFDYWFNDDIVGKTPILDMLEKLTAVMLLFTSEEECVGKKLLSQKQLDLIKKAKKKICNYADLWKLNTGLNRDFPDIKDIKTDELYEKYVRLFEESDDVYHNQVPEEVKKSIKESYWNALYGNQGRITDNLVGEQSADKTDSIPMDAFTYLTHKYLLFDLENLDDYRLFFCESRVFRSRYLFIIYNALLQMQMKEIEVDAENLADVITDYLGNQGSNYTVIETASSSRLLRELDEENRRNWFDRKLKGAEYKHYDLKIGWYLSNLEDIESFDETVVIIKKKDLPFVESTVTPEKPDVSFTEETNKEEGYAFERLTINPNLVARYNKEAELIRYKVVSKRKVK